MIADQSYSTPGTSWWFRHSKSNQSTFVTSPSNQSKLVNNSMMKGCQDMNSWLDDLLASKILAYVIVIKILLFSINIINTKGILHDVQLLLTECVNFRRQREALVRKYDLNNYDIGMFINIFGNPASNAALDLFGIFTYQKL